ncbi:MAG: hypothetical protein ACRD0B_00305 [Acidimicrobiales bacterium]
MTRGQTGAEGRRLSDDPTSAFCRDRVTYERCYELCKFACLVQSNDPELRRLVELLLGPFAASKSAGSSGRTYLISRTGPERVSLQADGEVVLSDVLAFEVFHFLLWDVSQRAISSENEHLALHAGCVVRGGRGLVLPAPSGSGKSTLTAGLVAAGCDYLSDEVALLDLSTGMLRPFPRPLGMSQRAIGFLPGLEGRLPPELTIGDRPEGHVPPAAIRPNPLGGPCELAYVIVPEHVPGGPTRLEPIRRSEAVLAMVGNAFNFGRFKGAGLVALGPILQGVRPYRLRMGDLEEAVALVMSAMVLP